MAQRLDSESLSRFTDAGIVGALPGDHGLVLVSPTEAAADAAIAKLGGTYKSSKCSLQNWLHGKEPKSPKKGQVMGAPPALKGRAGQAFVLVVVGKPTSDTSRFAKCTANALLGLTRQVDGMAKSGDQLLEQLAQMAKLLEQAQAAAGRSTDASTTQSRNTKQKALCPNLAFFAEVMHLVSGQVVSYRWKEMVNFVKNTKDRKMEKLSVCFLDHINYEFTDMLYWADAINHLNNPSAVGQILSQMPDIYQHASSMPIYAIQLAREPSIEAMNSGWCCVEARHYKMTPEVANYIDAMVCCGGAGAKAVRQWMASVMRQGRDVQLNAGSTVWSDSEIADILTGTKPDMSSRLEIDEWHRFAMFEDFLQLHVISLGLGSEALKTKSRNVDTHFRKAQGIMRNLYEVAVDKLESRSGTLMQRGAGSNQSKKSLSDIPCVARASPLGTILTELGGLLERLKKGGTVEAAGAWELLTKMRWLARTVARVWKPEDTSEKQLLKITNGVKNSQSLVEFYQPTSNEPCPGEEYAMDFAMSGGGCCGSGAPVLKKVELPLVPDGELLGVPVPEKDVVEPISVGVAADLALWCTREHVDAFADKALRKVEDGEFDRRFTSQGFRFARSLLTWSVRGLKERSRKLFRDDLSGASEGQSLQDIVARAGGKVENFMEPLSLIFKNCVKMTNGGASRVNLVMEAMGVGTPAGAVVQKKFDAEVSKAEAEVRGELLSQLRARFTSDSAKNEEAILLNFSYSQSQGRKLELGDVPSYNAGLTGSLEDLNRIAATFSVLGIAGWINAYLDSSKKLTNAEISSLEKEFMVDLPESEAKTHRAAAIAAKRLLREAAMQSFSVGNVPKTLVPTLNAASVLMSAGDMPLMEIAVPEKTVESTLSYLHCMDPPLLKVAHGRYDNYGAECVNILLALANSIGLDASKEEEIGRWQSEIVTKGEAWEVLLAYVGARKHLDMPSQTRGGGYYSEMGIRMNSGKFEGKATPDAAGTIVTLDVSGVCKDVNDMVKEEEGHEHDAMTVLKEVLSVFTNSMVGWAGDGAKFYLEDWSRQWRPLANLWAMYRLAVQESRDLSPTEQTTPWMLFTRVVDAKDHEKESVPARRVAFNYVFNDDMDQGKMIAEATSLKDSDVVKKEWKELEELRKEKIQQLAFVIVARTHFDEWEKYGKDIAGIKIEDKLRKVSDMPKNRRKFLRELAKYVTRERLDAAVANLKYLQEVIESFPFLLVPFAKQRNWLKGDPPELDKDLAKPKELQGLPAQLIKAAGAGVGTASDMSDRIWGNVLLEKMPEIEKLVRTAKSIATIFNDGDDGDKFLTKIQATDANSFFYIIRASLLLDSLWTSKECGETRRCVEDQIGRGDAGNIGRRTTMEDLAGMSKLVDAALKDAPGKTIDEVFSVKDDKYDVQEAFNALAVTSASSDENAIVHLLTKYMLALPDDAKERAFNTLLRLAQKA